MNSFSFILVSEGEGSGHLIIYPSCFEETEQIRTTYIKMLLFLNRDSICFTF